MENKLPSVKKIKKSTPIQFVANSNIITKLYQVIGFLSKTISDEKIQAYGKEVESIDEIIKGNKMFSEEWMIHVTTLAFLISQLEDAALKQGLVYEEDGEKVLKETEEILSKIIGEDSSLSDQSQSQPE